MIIPNVILSLFSCTVSGLVACFEVVGFGGSFLVGLVSGPR